jgi:hypothetical protein
VVVIAIEIDIDINSLLENINISYYSIFQIDCFSVQHIFQIDIAKDPLLK